ncbi:MAG: hypothetical protein BGO96_03220 [Micrococcales bacterium 73-15]|nr:MAG: hypothetical protein BGO96_03220 [Micrococcales bacterium 73-15]
MTGDPLERLQRQVPLAALDTAHVGPMDAEHVSELLLAQPALHPDQAQVLSDPSLQLTFHTDHVAGPLLMNLQTHQ